MTTAHRHAQAGYEAEARLQSQITRLTETNKRLITENERLREALKSIVDYEAKPIYHGESAFDTCDKRLEHITALLQIAEDAVDEFELSDITSQNPEGTNNPLPYTANRERDD